MPQKEKLTFFINDKISDAAHRIKADPMSE
jgi:hypothetical protein